MSRVAFTVSTPVVGAGVLLAAFLGAGCGTPDHTRPAGSRPNGVGVQPVRHPNTSERPAPAQVTTVATAIVARVAVYEAPDAGGRLVLSLEHPQPSGAPLIFVVREQRPAWLLVSLPVRPNGSTGWVRRSDVRLTQHTFRILVELGAHRIRVYHGTEVIDDEPVGVGKRDTPTPGGSYYTKELLRPPDPNGPYGPFAYGLSGFSNVLTDFAGGEGVIGIHGTNDPSLLGHDVSHGCIRMSNAGITRLVGVLPLGVPVEIRR
jgi:lipoprotein-anchoring transpeptidase ErfK/SrfK